MRVILFGLLAVMCFCKPAKAEFQLFFDAPLYTLAPDGSTSVDLFLRSTDPAFFGPTNSLQALAFTVRLNNSSFAEFTGVSWITELDNGTPFLGNTSEFSFQQSLNMSSGLAGSGPAGGPFEARLATFFVATTGTGTSSLEIDFFSPVSATNELTFETGGIDFDSSATSLYSFSPSTITAVPEPTSLALVGLASAGAFCNRRVRGLLRRKKQVA